MIAIDSIYAAAFDRGLLPALIERLCGEFGAFAGYLAWTDLGHGDGFQAQPGNDSVWPRRRSRIDGAVQRCARLDLLHARADGGDIVGRSLSEYGEMRAGTAAIVRRRRDGGDTAEREIVEPVVARSAATPASATSPSCRPMRPARRAAEHRAGAVQHYRARTVRPLRHSGRDQRRGDCRGR